MEPQYFLYWVSLFYVEVRITACFWSTVGYNAHCTLLSPMLGSLPIMDELCKRFYYSVRDVG